MRRFVLAGIMAFCIATSTASAAELKLGYIDMQKALNTSEAGKGAKEQLAAKVKNYQEAINVKQEEIKKLKDDLEKQGMLLSETVRAAKEKDYQQRLKEFQRYTKDAEDELRTKDEEFTRKILEGMEKVIKEFGLKNGFTFIFAKNDAILVFANEKSDVTEEVLKLFNNASRKK